MISLKTSEKKIIDNVFIINDLFYFANLSNFRDNNQITLITSVDIENKTYKYCHVFNIHNDDQFYSRIEDMILTGYFSEGIIAKGTGEDNANMIINFIAKYKRENKIKDFLE